MMTSAQKKTFSLAAGNRVCDTQRLLQTSAQNPHPISDSTTLYDGSRRDGAIEIVHVFMSITAPFLHGIHK